MNEPTLFEEVTGIPADPGHKARHEYRIAEGRRRRDRGINRANANEQSEFAAVCQEAIKYLASKPQAFTSDDVRDLVPLEPHHPNCWSAQFMIAVRSGQIVEVGTTRSKRPEAHRRRIVQYVGAQHA